MKKCPSCGAPLAAEEQAQCSGCGLIFAKWRDPKMREAEARLLAMGREASGGFPKWLVGVLVLIVAFPLLLIFVPDVGVPVLGGKLRYHFHNNDVFKHEASSSLLVSAPTAGAIPLIVDQIEIKLDSRLEATETDSGGNTTVKKTFEHLGFMSALATPSDREKNGQELAGWSIRRLINPSGGTLSTVGTAVNQMRGSMQIIQGHDRARRSGYYGNESPLPAAMMDVYEKIFSELSYEDVAAVDGAAWFEYPKERIRPGFSWTQRFHTTLRSKWFGAEMDEPITYSVRGFKREGSHFLAIIEWDTKLSPHLLQTSDLAWPLLSDGILSGRAHGQAAINYSDGVLQRMEGEIVLTLNPTLGSAPRLLQTLGVPTSALVLGQAAPLEMKVTQKSARL